MLRTQPRSLEVILGTSARVCDVIKTHKIRMYALRSAILGLVGVVILEQPQPQASCLQLSRTGVHLMNAPNQNLSMLDPFNASATCGVSTANPSDDGV